MKRLLLLLVMALMTQVNLVAQSTGVADKVIHLKDGSKVVAQIIDVKQEEHITLRLTGGETMKIYYNNIKKITNAYSSRKKPGIPRFKGELVLLNDGSKIYGKIIKYDPTSNLVLTTKNGSELVFPSEEIQLIRYNKRTKKPLYISRNGFYHETDLGVVLGRENVNTNNVGNFSIHTINGYRFSPLIHVGAGIGLDFQPGFHIVPYYLNIGGELGKAGVVPIYFANVGYSYAEGKGGFTDFIEDIEGGTYLHFGGGLKFKLHNYALQVKIGYKSTEVTLRDDIIDWSGRDGGNFQTKRNIRRFAATVGISF